MSHFQLDDEYVDIKSSRNDPSEINLLAPQPGYANHSNVSLKFIFKYSWCLVTLLKMIYTHILSLKGPKNHDAV